MSTRSPSHRVHHVLVVDDAPDVLEATACILRIHGCKVDTACSGAEALQAFAQGIRPCMMLLDLRMPDMDGWEVWDQMRVRDGVRETPVVIISGDPPDAVRAHRVGIRAFLQKPRSADDIVASIEQHCRVGVGASRGLTCDRRR